MIPDVNALVFLATEGVFQKRQLHAEVNAHAITAQYGVNCDADQFKGATSKVCTPTPFLAYLATNATMPAVSMKVITDRRLRGLSRANPQRPWPLVQPFPIRVPIPISKPPRMYSGNVIAKAPGKAKSLLKRTLTIPPRNIPIMNSRFHSFDPRRPANASLKNGPKVPELPAMRPSTNNANAVAPPTNNPPTAESTGVNEDISNMEGESATMTISMGREH
mmetsp:Transcript_106377/g.167965  ORF Transcript_106377/g.167965 Transcript_106377/m.167965 type:complete len:220 (-) Transcript_106377:9-668(-)